MSASTLVCLCSASVKATKPVPRPKLRRSLVYAFDVQGQAQRGTRLVMFARCFKGGSG